MDKEKWNDIEKIMKSGQLEFDRDNNEILCIICEKVLINTYNGPCGCRYCLECITKYLNGEEKICPGNTDYCKTKLLSINRNILLDQPMNKKILETIVKCPHQNCEFKDKLREIKYHMRICDSQSIECPFLNIGCQECNLVNTNMKNHMLREIVSHSKLLFEFIDNLNNEIKLINTNNIKLEKENNDLKKSIEDSKLKYENDNREIKENIKEIENKLIVEQRHVVELEKEIKVMHDERELFKEDSSENKKCIQDLKLQYESENRVIKENFTKLKNALVEEQKVVVELERVLKISQNERELMKKDVTENKKCLNDSNVKYQSSDKTIMEKFKEIKNKFFVDQKNTVELKTEVKEGNDERELMKQDLPENKKETETKIDEINKTITDLKMISNVMNEMKTSQSIQKQQNFVGLEWRIDKWRQKMEEARAKIYQSLDSDTFYSHRNGYKMSLSVWPNGWWNGEGTHLSVWCGVMRGEYDDFLPWLFKHDITFELINQHTAQIHTSCTLRHDDHYGKPEEIFYWRDIRKPKQHDNIKCICYNYKFISLEKLSNNHSLIVNDQILIRCRVTVIN